MNNVHPSSRERTCVHRLPTRLIAGLALAAACLLLAQAVQAGDLADVKARGKLIMLCYPTQTSTFVAVNIEAMREKDLRLDEVRESKYFKGIDVDLLQGFAKSLGVELEIRPLTKGYDALLPALVARQGDLVASSLSSTPKREESADFSDSYLTSWVVVAVPAKSKIASLDDLKGKKVALMHGSSQLEFVQSLVPDVKIMLTDFSLENYVAVQEGQADFTLMDSPAPVGESVAVSYPDLKVALRAKEFGYRVAFRKGSDLLAPFNAYIASAKQSGELDRIAERYQAPWWGDKKPAPTKP
jgi:polar amino acid transport system substrate-binding protein